MISRDLRVRKWDSGAPYLTGVLMCKGEAGDDTIAAGGCKNTECNSAGGFRGNSDRYLKAGVTRVLESHGARPHRWGRDRKWL